MTVAKSIQSHAQIKVSKHFLISAIISRQSIQNIINAKQIFFVILVGMKQKNRIKCKSRVAGGVQ